MTEPPSPLNNERFVPETSYWAIKGTNLIRALLFQKYVRTQPQPLLYKEPAPSGESVITQLANLQAELEDARALASDLQQRNLRLQDIIDHTECKLADALGYDSIGRFPSTTMMLRQVADLYREVLRLRKQ